MKTETLDPGQAEFTIQPTFQTAPFVVRGDVETITDMYQEGKQQYTEYLQEKRSRLASKVATTAVEAVSNPLQTITNKLGYVASNVLKQAEIRSYDKKNGTRFGAELQERAGLERDLRMARKLGLIGGTYCAKHEKALRATQTIR